MRIRPFIIVFVAILLVAGLGYVWAEDVITGSAAWYGLEDTRKIHDPPMNSNGTLFDENALTCAMRSRDFGKYYKVTNLANGKSVIVQHVDFGPAIWYRGRFLNRVMDLSKHAFSLIADLDTGVIKVKIERVSE